MATQKKLTCPQCGKPAEKDTSCFPFCSDRCQTLDLGAWATEKYRVPAVENELESEADGMPGKDLIH